MPVRIVVPTPVKVMPPETLAAMVAVPAVAAVNVVAAAMVIAALRETFDVVATIRDVPVAVFVTLIGLANVVTLPVPVPNDSVVDAPVIFTVVAPSAPALFALSVPPEITVFPV